MAAHSLDILFLTDFSDACFRSIPAIVQIGDAVQSRLTILHVFDPARVSQTSADEQLNRFFPEADEHFACYRTAVPGPWMEAVRSHLEVWPVNLIVAPASTAKGFSRIGHHPLRSRLAKECGVPVWTAGRRVELKKLAQPVRNVACWLDFYSLQTGHLAFAMEYANKLNAKLHLLRALPEIHEGSLILGALQERALYPGGATEEILHLCANSRSRPEVHVSCGDEGHTALTSMLRECDADVVFLPVEEPSLARWLGLRAPLSDRIPCSAIYVGDQLNTPVWNLQAGTRHRTTGAPREAVRLRGQLGVVAASKGASVAAISWLS